VIVRRAISPRQRDHPPSGWPIDCHEMSAICRTQETTFGKAVIAIPISDQGRI
jgi:hypothetical protein